MNLVTDEHVPRVFVSTLRSNGYTVFRANDLLGEATDDATLLRRATAEDAVLITHDMKDFGGPTGESVDHAGVVVYTDANWVRDSPSAAVTALNRVREQYSRDALRNEIVWLDQWR
ncbi:hypothetical protein DM867_04685 [Halosegnis rubeus]|uniref:DUF5615 domain-containing protein n=1 Tax=Halosegnis rubeus TaxID=2212850 RepID=A0A5N5UH75_9EURY|nr:DUF5615 family PIN-like protein [Halosegnis rubeus]KAB7515362.1 hypothetical protein DMP03_09070 [Halosegnis rubeus]KAB7516414.1 hypothetical protein DM867_04685 [Halosegnis rubeus]KAB7517597.1 hypothetical protein DP108_08435 [Halosegnis rubeus]